LRLVVAKRHRPFGARRDACRIDTPLTLAIRMSLRGLNPCMKIILFVFILLPCAYALILPRKRVKAFVSSIFRLRVMQPFA
jgi:hypothetical protein